MISMRIPFSVKRTARTARALVLSGLIGGAAGGLHTRASYAQKARVTGKIAADLQGFADQYELVVRKLELNKFSSNNSVTFRGSPDTYYTHPVKEINILTDVIGRGPTVRTAPLGDIIAHPEKYPKMYAKNGKYSGFTPQNIKHIKNLMIMEQQISPELKQIREKERIAKKTGFKTGARNGSIAGGTLAAGLMLGRLIKRKRNLRRALNNSSKNDLEN